MKDALFQKLILVCSFVFSMLASLDGMAQIPQNIEVEGEPSSIWQYATYVLVLAAIVIAILLLGKFFKKRN